MFYIDKDDPDQNFTNLIDPESIWSNVTYTNCCLTSTMHEEISPRVI